MSAFDDLLDLGEPSETPQGTDPFDPFSSGQTTNQSAGNSSGDLLDLGFDAQISTENGSSAKVNFEANTNPLYELTNSESKMASDSANPLYEFSNEPVQKDLKSEPSNLLYEYMQNEGTTNGHVEDGLSNGREQEVDLLGGGDLNGGDLMGGESENVDGDSGDLLGNSGPVIDDDFGVTAEESRASETQLEEIEPQSGEVIQTKSRSSSESSEPEQEKEESAQKPAEPVSEADGVSEMETAEQASGPLDEGPKESVIENNVEEVEDKVETEAATEVLDEGTNEVKADIEPETPDEKVEESVDNQINVSEQEESKVDEQNINVEEEQQEIDDQKDIIPSTKTDEQEVKESAVESESAETAKSENSIEVEQVTPSKTEPAEEEDESRSQVEEMTPEDKVEPERSEEVEKIAPEEAVETEANDVKEVVEPADKVEEVGTEELELEKPTEELEPEKTTEELEPEKPIEELEPEKPTEELQPEKPAEEIEPEKPAEEIEPETPSQEPVPEQASIEAQSIEQPEVAEEKEADKDENQVEPEEAPQMQETEKKPDTLELGDEDDVVVPKTAAVDETRNSVPDENALKVNGTSEISENGVSEEDAVRDPNIFRETHEKEEVHFAEMSNVRQKFESGQTTDEEQTYRRVSVKDEYDQGGEFENEPIENPDVVKGTDKPKEELPEIGTAKNLVNRFKSIQEEKAQPVVSQKRQSPPRDIQKVEYESQPSEHLPQYEGQVESGVFESEPKGHEDVVRSGDQTEDYKPEQGSAKNILNKFKEFQTETGQQKTPEKRELTPDRSGKVEYVSEPRGEKIEYNETQTESGVFENVPKEEEDVVRSGDKADEILPEAGLAKSLLSKFKQMESEVGNRPPPSPKREKTEKPAKPQVTQEQKGYLERYEPQLETGEFENEPEVRAEVVRSGDHTEEVLPEVGTAKKTMERFKEIEKQSSSPVSSRPKEITPPREQSPGKNVTGVFESTPTERADVVKSGEVVQEELPEQGTTKNILNRFKEIQTSGSQSSSPGRKPKEITPPPESGVYENKPKEHLVIEERQAESGVLENTPSKSQADVAREREATPESELPEQGMAKNLVSRWKQRESASNSAKSTSSTSPRFKEFTPPRDSRGPLSPKSPAGVTNGVHPSDLPGQYQPQESSLIYENKPEVKEGVYREADTDWTEGMPAPNTTSSILQRFKSIQDDAKASEVTPEPIHRKDDSPPPQPDTEEKGMFKVVQTEKCAACQKTVYAMEKLEMNGHIYHKNCFKCSHCSARLTPKTFSMNEGVIYCVNHFKQLFARKGNYDEGFGRQQYKKKWQGDKPEGATA